MIIRIARHTKNLDEIVNFYTQIIKLSILGSFRNHDGYDGVFIGKEGLNWHLEFTSSSEQPQTFYDEDDLLVFYPLNNSEIKSIINKIDSHKIEIIEPRNPYWKKNGVLIKDPDGNRVIISSQKVQNG